MKNNTTASGLMGTSALLENASIETDSSFADFSQVEYREMDVNPIRKVDPVLELNKNIEALEDLQQRLSFMIREVGSMLSSKKPSVSE